MGHRAWRGPAASLTGLVGYLGALQVTQAHGPSYVTLPSGEYASTAYNLSKEIVNDFEVRAHIRLASYSTFANRVYVIGSGNTVSPRDGWALNFEPNGEMRLIGASGGLDFNRVSSASFGAGATGGEWMHVKVTRVGTVLRFHRSFDGDTWTQIGADLELIGTIDTYVDIGHGVGALRNDGALAARGVISIDVARVRTWEGGVAGVGTLTLDFDPARAITGRPGGFTAATGELWTFTGATYEVFYGQNVTPGARYMALTGNDTTGDGTIDAPYRSLAKIAAIVQPGDTVYIRGGYYDVVSTDTYLNSTTGEGQRVKFSGTEANPITVRSYPGEWAIFDGINHALWPMDATSNTGGYEPNVLMFVGQWVNWERMEIRNGVGRGARFFILDCKVRHMVFQNNHADGFAFQGSRNELAYNLFQDNYSIGTAGNSGNGMVQSFSSQMTEADRWPGETDSADNHVHHNVARNCSDDGFNIFWSVSGNLYEYNVSFDHGYGVDGDGGGYKLGLKRDDVALQADTVVRFNLAWACDKAGFNTNHSTGLLIHNNTARDVDQFASFQLYQASGEANEAYNNLSLTPTVAHRGVTTASVHTHNAGYTGAWAGTGNFETVDVDPVVMSLDWTHADFMRLGPTSPYLSNGKVITGGSTTLGAIPDGQDFAGGWDWRALVDAYPSHGLKARALMQPLEQSA